MTVLPFIRTRSGQARTQSDRPDRQPDSRGYPFRGTPSPERRDLSGGKSKFDCGERRLTCDCGDRRSSIVASGGSLCSPGPSGGARTPMFLAVKRF